MTRAWLGVVFGVGWLTAALPAHAQRSEDRAGAEALFAEGSGLVNSGRFDEGCPKLEMAQRLVPGIGVTLYVGECLEQRGDLAGAWRQFKDAEDLAAQKGDARQKVARERAERLAPKVARIRVVVRAEARLAGLALAADGVPIDPARWGGEYAVEPKVPHRIGASAPGREPWEQVLTTGAGEAVTVEVPVLRESGASAAPAFVSGPAVDATPASSPPPASTSSRLPATRIASYALGGAGVVALAIGIAFGVDAKSKMDDSNSSGDCHPNDHCNAAGLAERSDALDAAAASTVAVVGGAACLAAGAALFFLAPPKSPSVALVPRAGPDGAGLTLHARW